MTPSGLYQICKRLSQSSDIHVSPHKLRHTFAITYLGNGGSVVARQKTLGHETLDMTLRYAQLVTDDLIAAHAAHSPVAGLSTRPRRRP